jgi:hypothetical protein
MDWSTSHKVKIIGALALIVLVIVSIFVYFKFFKHDPTCFDRKQNQGERGVDCGGTCSLMCSTDIKPLLPLWTRPIKITGDVYAVVSYIENQNKGNGAEKVSYEIRMYDDNNILATEPIKGETFIGPNDRTAIYETRIKVGNRIPKTAFITFAQPMVFTRVPDKFNDQNLIIEQEELLDIDTMPKLSAVIRNTTFETFYNLPVVAIIYNDQGNVIAASQTVIDEILPEGTAPAYFTWPEPLSGIPARREIIPRINPFTQAQ